MAMPMNPMLSRSENGVELPNSVVVAANKMVSVWCKAVNDLDRQLQGLSWRSSNGTRLPVVERGKSSNTTVYMERYLGRSNRSYTDTWIRILRINSSHPASTAVYTCVANYKQIFFNQSITIKGR